MQGDRGSFATVVNGPGGSIFKFNRGKWTGGSIFKFNRGKWTWGSIFNRGKWSPGVESVPTSIQFYYWYMTSNDA